MPALTMGTKAPDFDLKTVDGKPFSLTTQLAQTPVVLVFFKVSCPTCQYALPFYERLYKAYGEKGIALLGVSQNNGQDTAAFAKQFGITFPILLDETHYPVSNAYGLTNVPTLFWIAQDGEIEISSVGWVKTDFELVNGKMAGTSDTIPVSMFKPGEDVRDFRAG